jgi:transcription antitermination factor NusA-like protein
MSNQSQHRGYLLPDGCKDLGDVLKLEANKLKTKPGPVLHTNEEIRDVLRRHIPELANGTVEIVAMARNVGRRCLLAVCSHDLKVCPVKVCSFERGKRTDAIIRELGGELPSVTLWDPSAEVLIRRVLGGLERVVFDAATKRAVVTVHPLSRNRVIVGQEDQIVRMLSELAGLVSELTGWKVSLAERET